MDIFETGCRRCGNNKIENRDTKLCASCANEIRKAERLALRPKKLFKPIAKVSQKRKEENKTYAVKRKEHLRRCPECQMRLVGCTKRATQVHHAAKRGKNLNEEKYFISCCSNCHDITERVLSAKERREKGLLITPTQTI